MNRDEDSVEQNFGLHGMRGNGTLPRLRKNQESAVTVCSTGPSFAQRASKNGSSGARPINLPRALFERLRNCETGEFAIVESLLNILATNVFQIHHGGCQVFVAQPFLEFTNTTNIAFQVDGSKCMPKLVQEPVAAIRPLGAAVAVP